MTVEQVFWGGSPGLSQSELGRARARAMQNGVEKGDCIVVDRAEGSAGAKLLNNK